jgi:hypothetical protein
MKKIRLILLLLALALGMGLTALPSNPAAADDDPPPNCPFPPCPGG